MNQNAVTLAMIRQIVAHARCSVCGHHYSKSDVRVLGRQDDAWAMSANCRECRAQALFLAVMGGIADPVPTDLMPEEWERFKTYPPISTDEVIAFYRVLDAYDGDLSEIMDEPLPKE